MKALKKTERKYYKYIDIPWVQPRVSSNGTLGGDSFAVTGENLSSSYPAYQAFDTSTSTAAGNTTTYNLTTYLYFYNPNPICISNVQVTCNGQGQCYSPYTVTFYGSNDNSNWDYLATYTSGNSTWSATISIESLNYYSYYKIEVVNQNYGGIYGVQGYIQDITITAIEKSPVESDSSDYDFYKDVEVYKTVKETIRNYYYSLEYMDVGTYTLNIPETGNYDIEMYGAGGGACGAMHSGAGYNVYGTSSGGSGAGFKGVLNLPAGKYTITVGAYGANGEFRGSSGATSASSGTATILQGIIEAGGGSGATATNGSTGTPGSGGTLSILDNSKIVSSVISSDGNDGQFKNVAGLSGFIANCPGGLSLYDDSQTGYGAGGGKIESNPAYNAQDGYFKISSSQKPVHYEDVDEYKAVKF